VNVDLSNNAINFADSEEDGHRVQVTMPKSDLNAHLKWNRAAGSDRPIGSMEDIPGFKAALVTALNSGYTDLDAMSTGLSLSTGVLTNAELQQMTANDLIMQYVLYKVYGSSSFDTQGKVFNPKDALNMTTSDDVAEAVTVDIASNNAKGGALDKMFRDLLAADPTRYFDASGKQITGLFEINADASGNGSWNIVEDDLVEIKLTFTFKAQVSRRVVSAQEQPLVGGSTPAESVTEEVILPAESKLHVRLQVKASA
jgi:hypothetical protein